MTVIRNPKGLKIDSPRRRHRKRLSEQKLPETGLEVFKKLEADFDELLESIPVGLIIDTVRRLSPATYMRYFRGYRPQSLGRAKVTEALRKEIYEKDNAAVADLVNLLWNQANRKLYKAMHEHVRKINENVEEIERIEDDTANEIIDDLLTKFSRKEILFCVRLNEVKFSEEVIEKRLIKGEDDWKKESSEEKEGPEGEKEQDTPETETAEKTADTQQESDSEVTPEEGTEKNT